MTIQDHERLGRGIDADPTEMIAVVDESSIEQAEVAGLSQGQIVRRRFVRHKGAMAGMIVLLAIVILAVTSVGLGPIPGWWKWEYTDLVPSNARFGRADAVACDRRGSAGPASISVTTPLDSTTIAGKDMFAMTMRGVQTSLTVIIVLGVLSTTIGVVIGSLSGYYGKRTDSVLMRFTDVIIVIPSSSSRRSPGSPSTCRASGRWRWPSDCSCGRVWRAWSGPSSSLSASASSSTPPVWPTPPTDGSSSSTSCPTPSARSSSPRRC